MLVSNENSEYLLKYIVYKEYKIYINEGDFVIIGTESNA